MDSSKCFGKPKKFRNPFAAPEDDQNPLCGVCGWKPSFLQHFSNMKVFMFCFVGLGVFQGMHGSYFGAVLPSIERRFGFSSTKIGTVKAMSDVSGIIAAVIVGHYGGSGHRPRWISAGTFIMGLAVLLFATPEFLFPVTSLSTATGGKATGDPKLNEEMCLGVTSNSLLNATNAEMVLACTAIDHDTDNMSPLIVFGLAEFLMGIGSAMPLILGLPFVDDNVSYKNTPIYFALSFAGRLFGPLLGLALGAGVNSVYFDLSNPPFKSTDPRWIAAWYLGFIVCGLGICFFAVTVGCFPANMPVKKSDANLFTVHTDEKSTKTVNQFGKPKQHAVNLKDLPRNLKRLLSNSIYMIKLGSQIVEGIAIAGYIGFSQKFIQNQFPVTPSVASLAGGIPPTFFGFLGIMIGSTIIKKFHFLPRHVSLMTVASALIASICYFSVLGMGCDTPLVVGLPDITTHIAVEKLDFGKCAAENQCNCHTTKFSPVCDTASGISYASPCFAGCLSSRWFNKTTYYMDCICSQNGSSSVYDEDAPVQSEAMHPSPVVSGLCPNGCTTFVAYIAVMCIAKLLMGIPLSGVLMIQFRVVDYDLKSIANAVSMVVMSALAFLPAPIIAGYIIDSACRYWQTSACAVQGACLLYDVNDFRVKLHASVGACKLVGAALDCLATYKMWDFTFDRDEKLPVGGQSAVGSPSDPAALQNVQPRNGSTCSQESIQKDPETASTHHDNDSVGYEALQEPNSFTTRL